MRIIGVIDEIYVKLITNEGSAFFDFLNILPSLVPLFVYVLYIVMR